jgi:type IV pilus assembly protein PilV
MMKPVFCFEPQRGFSLLEALITIVILSFGLLGQAGLQAKIQVSETESYQRAQAILLVQDMANRISASRANAASYLTNGTPLGTNDNQPANCSSLTGAALDQCEWSNQLKGAAEKQAVSGTALGAMSGARGCVEQVGTNPSVYRISVAWQGMSMLKAPSFSCGQNLYGDDRYRHAVATLVPVADLKAK